MPPRHREEAINTQLAVLISRYGVKAEAETIHLRGHERPDVLFELRGLRVVVEGKFEDHPNASEVVLKDARGRVQRGIAHIAAAVVYPKRLRTISTVEILPELETAQLKYRIVSETGETEWYEGAVSNLMDAFRRAQETLAQDDIVATTAKSLSERLEGVAALFAGQTGACDRLSDILGMPASKGETSDKAAARRETAAKVSALVIANALIFQEQLAATDGRIIPLRKLESETDVVGASRGRWRWIWENINYVPIFQLGEKVLEELPLSQNSTAAFRALLREAKEICTRQSALRHDLMGRIYHWLLHHAKYLGTYYTSVAAATLLLKLTMGKDWDRDFGDPSILADFKAADLACGTGTLLMATAQAVSDSYIKTRASSGRTLNPVDLQTLHRAIMENIIHGYDVLPTAVHLTASTLALLAPEVAFVRMNLFVMPMGVFGGTAHLGSLDFLFSPEIHTQFTLDGSHAEAVRTGAGKEHVAKARVPKLDLCVMNPPFVRSVGGNLLFGSLPDERGVLQAELRKQVKKLGASSTAGLGAVFVALADKYINENGRLAFVLPHALCSGEAWGETRQLLAYRYHLETVISSHDPDRPNFSENTALSEILFIARRLKKGEKPTASSYVSLWKNPTTIHEALDLAGRIEALHKGGIIRSPSGSKGEVFCLPASRGDENWHGALFSRGALAQIFLELCNGNVKVPGSAAVSVSLCHLEALGRLGYDRRDVHDAFTLIEDVPSLYPAFWNHEADKVVSVGQNSNSWLHPRVTAAPGRKLKSAAQVWAKAADLLLVERIRLNSHKVMAVFLEKPVLGNTWWTFLTDLTIEQKKALALWFNSSLGILMVYGNRVITEGPWVQMKKPAWETMPILDVRKLDPKQVSKLAAGYERLETQELQSISKLATDQTRAAIDDTLSVALGLPKLDNLREMLRFEPGLTGEPVNASRQAKEVALFGEEPEDQQGMLF